MTYSTTQLDRIRLQAAAFAYACGRFDEHYQRALLLPADADLPATVDFEREALAREVSIGGFPALWDELVAATSAVA